MSMPDDLDGNTILPLGCLQTIDYENNLLPVSKSGVVTSHHVAVITSFRFGFPPRLLQPHSPPIPNSRQCSTFPFSKSLFLPKARVFFNPVQKCIFEDVSPRYSKNHAKERCRIDAECEEKGDDYNCHGNRD